MKNVPFRASVKKVKSLYAKGMSMKAVGKIFGVDATSICKFMKNNGIAARRPGQLGHHWGPDHVNWKGDKAGYLGFHRRLDRKFGKIAKCSVCGMDDPRRWYEWANLTGNYHDIRDYKRMCRSCHFKYDGKRRKATGKRTSPLGKRVRKDCL